MTVRILIADDHEIVIEGIRTLLERARRDWEICGEARNGSQALEMMKELKPDVAVLDVTMPSMSGLEVSKQVSRLGLNCRVLIFTMHESDRLGVEVRAAGAEGYVLKSQAARDLVRAIDAILAGDTFYGAPSVSEAPAKSAKKPGTLLYQALAFA